MRLCRFEHQGRAQVGFYQDDSVVPLSAVAPDVPPTDSLLALLPGGDYRQQAKQWEAAAAKAQAPMVRPASGRQSSRPRSIA